MIDLVSIGERAKNSVKSLASVNEEKINKTLKDIAQSLLSNIKRIEDANSVDVEYAKSIGIAPSFIDRLLLNEKVIKGICDGVLKVVELPFLPGTTLSSIVNKEQGILIEKKLFPFGVIGMIYEARPNVTVDAFCLCFKTKNSVILKGGKEAINSNKIIVELIRECLERNGIDKDAVILIEDCDRQTTQEFMKMNKYVDLLIPRGGASLIKYAVENSTIPIIQTGTGNCHLYIDEFADDGKAERIIFNAKTQRYGVCNSLESIVVNAKKLNCLNNVYNSLQTRQVEMRCDERSYEVLKGKDNVVKADEQDYYTEYCNPIISVKTVDTLSEAIDWINEHSTSHSETIVTENLENAKEFMLKVDSSCVYHNASTRFSDGFVFGLGAEIGISTQKLHARGPMGLETLLTTKFEVSDVTDSGALRK